MDPNALDLVAWNSFFTTIWHIFLFTVFNATGALSFLTGHAIVPSLVLSNHIPANASVTRPVFYIIAVACWIFAWYQFIYMASMAFNAINPIYPRFTF